MSEVITFGWWLKQRRKERNITHEELAERIACSRITLIKIEAGERRPSRQVAELLAEQFNIPADEYEAFVTFARTGRTGQVLADGLEPDEARAPWRATYVRLTNLPAVLTSLVGREADEHTLLELLQPQSRVRLLTLTGAPGIGKTRLAMQVASDLVERFDDGVFLIKLATVTDPDLVVPTITWTLGVREVVGQAIEELLLQYVRDKRMLLVLDNFEQVLDAAPAVTRILEASPWLKVLITSREALHIRGERHFTVQPLVVPNLRQTGDLKALGTNPAIQLFVERAQEVEPDFTLTQENARDVASICSRLEGMPLAIELAAARARLLSPEAMLSRLEFSLNVLTGGARDLPERQRTLRGTIQWSYDLLSDGEQRLFRRLGLFVGGCTVEAAEAVCNAKTDLEVETRDGLQSLVDKSLLRRERTGGYPQGDVRFLMLEMIREYALERLEECGESQVAQERHAGFFLRLAEEAEPQLRGPQQLAWLNRLEIEHDNIRTVLRWALAHNAHETGLRMAGTLRWFWTQRSHYMEGLQWAKTVLAMPGAQARSPERAKALWSAGVLAWIQGEPEALPLLEESVAIWREVGDKRGLGYSLHHLGMAMLRGAHPEIARSIEIESIEMFRAVGDKFGQVLALGGLWNITIALEDADASSDHGGQLEQRSLLEEAIELAREIGDKWGLALALRNLGLMEMRQGENTSARPLLDESLDLQWEIGTKHEAAATLGSLAQLTQLEGDLGAAAELYDRSLQIYTECIDKHGMVISMVNIGGIEMRLGNTRRAAEVLTEALQIARELGSARHSIFTLEMIGWLMVASGQPARAALLLSAAKALRRVYTFSHPTVTRLEYKQYLESARAEVDEATWQQAWVKGEAMNIEDALQFASESLEVIDI